MNTTYTHKELMAQSLADHPNYWVTCAGSGVRVYHGTADAMWCIGSVNNIADALMLADEHADR